jgi:transposase-like protein
LTSGGALQATNAVEALHRSLRKVVKTRGIFPNDDAALKLLYLAIKSAGQPSARRRMDRCDEPIRQQ